MNHKGYLLFGIIFYNQKQIFSGMLSVWNNIAFAEKMNQKAPYIWNYVLSSIYIYNKNWRYYEFIKLSNQT